MVSLSLVHPLLVYGMSFTQQSVANNSVKLGKEQKTYPPE